MNKVILVGRLTADPELKTGNTSFTRFTLAVDRRKENTDFINCVAFGKTAEFVSNYFKKGQKMGLEGRIQTGSYENRDGKKVKKRELNEPNAEPSYEQSTFVPVDELADAGLPFN